jgi:virulence factor Mce-like protein
VTKQAPTIGRLLIMVGFALSCFGLLLFLWLSFGGPLPLKPKGYRVNLLLPDASQLAKEADVRISGVPVGKVKLIERDGPRARATIELDERYAPLRADARATLREKTLLGETYVELTPGSDAARRIPEGGTLPARQVTPSVKLDQVLRSLDRPTRTDLRRWLRSYDGALRARGADLNDAVGNLAPAVEQANGVLGVLDAQDQAVRTLISDGGRVFGSIGSRRAATDRLIRAGNRVFAATAARNRDLGRTVDELPGFLRSFRRAATAADVTGRDLGPVARALRPAARDLRPTLDDLSALAPDLGTTLLRLPPAIDASRRGLPALTRTLRASRPLLGQVFPLGRELVPMVQFAELYRRELITSWAKVAAATQASFPDPGTGKPLHYLRLVAPVTPDVTALYSERPGSNRHNPYYLPGGLAPDGDQGPKAFDCRHAARPALPVLGAAPPCREQGPLRFRGRLERFPRLLPDPPDRTVPPG